MLSSLTYWSRKLHRLVMWPMIALGGFMSLSGYLMHRELADQSTWFFDTIILRDWHDRLSVVFSFVLWLMIITGFILWIAPKINQWRVKNKTADTASSDAKVN